MLVLPRESGVLLLRRRVACVLRWEGVVHVRLELGQGGDVRVHMLHGVVVVQSHARHTHSPLLLRLLDGIGTEDRRSSRLLLCSPRPSSSSKSK